ncbi:hypothetical protein ABMX48_04210 [Streptomyces cavourensis]
MRLGVLRVGAVWGAVVACCGPVPPPGVGRGAGAEAAACTARWTVAPGAGVAAGAVDEVAWAVVRVVRRGAAAGAVLGLRAAADGGVGP